MKRKPIDERGKHLAVILTEMCDRVGADTSEMWWRDEEDHPDFQPDWWKNHAWTKEQEAEFIEWATAYLYDNLEARQELGPPTIKKTKTACKRWVASVVWNSGWTTKEDV